MSVQNTKKLALSEMKEEAFIIAEEVSMDLETAEINMTLAETLIDQVKVFKI